MKRSTVILLLILMAACSKQSLQSTYDKQASYIEGFVSAQMKKDTLATLTKNGNVYRLTLHDTLDVDRDSLKPGGMVSLVYGCFTLTGNSISLSNLVSTNWKELAQAAGWTLTDTTHFKLDTLVLDNSLVEGLAAGLEGVQQWDEGYILFTGKYGFGKYERGTIPARSALAYYYFIENISNEEE